MEITREEIVKIINKTIELALVDKANNIHNHDDIYQQKNEIYTKKEIDNLFNTNKIDIKNFISEEIEKKSNELINNNITSNEVNEKTLTSITEQLKEIEKFVNSINKTLEEINNNYELFSKTTTDYSENISTLIQDVNKIKECIPQLITAKEFHSQFEIIERKVFNL